jgi:hypothetical protein
MKDNVIKNYFINLSLQKGIPKFVFIFIYLSFLILSVIFIKAVEINHRNSYIKFFNQASTLIEVSPDENNNMSYEVYYESFSRQLAETSQIKNMVFIIWNQEGIVLWHSNKLIEKVVGNDLQKNNQLLKGFSFLDIPEKNFKPYDSFKRNREKLAVDTSIIEFQKNMVHHFYKVSGKKNLYYVEVLREFHSIIPKNTYLYLFAGILLISGFLAWLTSLFIRMYLLPVNRMVISMESYNKNKKVEPVYDYSENELGKMIKTYNVLLNHLSSPTTNESAFDDSDGKNQKVIDYLQEKLLKKSIQKSEQMELLLFPRRPQSDFRMFVTIEEHEGVTFVLYMYFDINNIESNLEKHIIQDKFKELSLKTNQTREIAGELFNDLVVHADFGPGFLLIRLFGEEMEWVRSGPFHLYLVDSKSGESSLMEEGVDYLPTELVAESKIDLKNKLLLVISDDIMELLNVDAVEFNNLVIWFPEDSSKDGKLILSQILSNIDNINQEVLRQSPMISLIRLK